MIKKLSSLSDVKEEILKVVIDKYKIKSLLTTKFDKDYIKEKLDDFKSKLKNIDNEILNEVKTIYKDSKKYEESIELY